MKMVSRGDVEPLANRQGGELTNITVGLGWHAAGSSAGRQPFDLDVSLALLDHNEKAHRKEDLLFYGQKKILDGKIFHSGDNTRGAENNSTGDQEQITIRDLNAVPDKYVTLRISVSVHQAKISGYNFGKMKNAYLRIIDNDSGRQLMRYNLTGDFYDQTCVVVADLVRDRSTWNFTAVGASIDGGFGDLLRMYGFAPKGAAA